MNDTVHADSGTKMHQVKSRAVTFW